MPIPHKTVAIADRSCIGEARRAAIAMAQLLGFNDAERSNIAIAATELATNTLVHAGKGELLLTPVQYPGCDWLDLVAIDNGPGIPDIGRALEDGYSTVGTSGQGLGAVRRLSHESALHSDAAGTVVWSRFTRGRASRTGIVNLPVEGEFAVGDSYGMYQDGDRSVYMMVDGLGHGPGAAAAAAEALITMAAYPSATPGDLLQRAHENLKKTRGAAMAVASFRPADASLTYSSIGNITAMLIDGTASRTLPSQNGTVGGAMPRAVQEFHYPAQSGNLLAMFTDGLQTRATPAKYSGFQTKPAGLLAALMYREFTRRRDDATVMVTRLGDLA